MITEQEEESSIQQEQKGTYDDEQVEISKENEDE